IQVGSVSSVIETAASTHVQTESSALGDVVENETITQLPLNGRYFLDLALLTTGTTFPSTNNRTFLALPSALRSINAAGAREDSANYVFDGIDLTTWPGATDLAKWKSVPWLRGSRGLDG